MPRSGGDAAPREYVARGQWPSGRLRKDAPASAVYGQEFVKRLLKALKAKGGPSMRSIEREARVSRRTIERVLAGEVLPDFGAVARLEVWLEADLWPGPDLRAQGRTDHPT
ncbi:hypothetical protein [Kocuria marina]|uniref:hypothetical protein n=1 Tax=Kocuria marina TaxID=223184 RepID=UPI0021A659AA|nr:hypothetical protein [Kocuria marina]MCT1616440.1 hypothetical protein [Kocuria marina]